MARTLRALLAGALCLSLMMGAEAFGTSRSCLSSRPAAAFAKEVLRNGPTVPPSNFKVAFIGDQGISDTAKAVLQKIKEKKVDIVIHAGDFDYDNDPKGWDDQLNEVLGPDFPYFASIGNHDSLRWGVPRGYQWHLEQRMERINASSFCTGETGVKYACNYNGFLFALSGVGSRQLDHPDFIDDVFDGALNPWRAVAWHKNQRLFQVGGKINEVGYGVYEAGRRNGAIICTAHEHSYSRTHLMADFSEQVIASTDPKMTLTEGKSFSFVTGLGGRGIREYKWGLQDNPWWASTGSSDDGIGHGALICTFNLNGNAREAECELEDSNNVVWDRFSLSSNVTGVSLKPTCVGEMKAFSVENPLEDIQELPASASRKESTPFVFVNEKLLTLGGEGHAAFRFHLEGVKVPLIDSIRFQIYGMESGEGGQPITIRGLKRFPEAGELISSVPMTESHVVWEEEDEDWEQGTVWVSPDLHEIVKELLAENTAEKAFSLSFVVSGPGQRVIASSDLDPCLAPSLLVELKKDC